MCRVALRASAPVLAAFLLLVAPTRGEQSFEEVARQLQDDADLGTMHRGYVQYVASHPTLAAIEGDWWRLLSDPGRQSLVARLDRAIEADLYACAALDAYYDALARNPGTVDTLGAAIEELAQIDPLLRRHLIERLADYAKSLNGVEDLKRPGGTVERSVSLGYLAEGPLRSLTEALLSTSSASSVVLRAIGDTDDTLVDGLAQYLYGDPHSAVTWHRRNRVLAEDAHARSWIRYWHRVVAETAGLGAVYWGYLLTLDPKSVGQASAPWPPKFAPPPAVTDASSAKTDTEVPFDAPTRPDTPEVQVRRPVRPAPPTPPERPLGPSRPVLPVYPERPTPPDE